MRDGKRLVGILGVTFAAIGCSDDGGSETESLEAAQIGGPSEGARSECGSDCQPATLTFRVAFDVDVSEPYVPGEFREPYGARPTAPIFTTEVPIVLYAQPNGANCAGWSMQRGTDPLRAEFHERNTYHLAVSCKRAGILPVGAKIQATGKAARFRVSATTWGRSAWREFVAYEVAIRGFSMSRAYVAPVDISALAETISMAGNDTREARPNLHLRRIAKGLF